MLGHCFNLCIYSNDMFHVTRRLVTGDQDDDDGGGDDDVFLVSAAAFIRSRK